MYGFIRVAAAVPHITPADVEANAKEISALIAKAKRQGVRLAVFPELVLSGCTVSDLLSQKALTEAAERKIGEIAALTDGIAVAVGFPYLYDGNVSSVIAVMNGGRVVAIVPKNECVGARMFRPLKADSVNVCGQTVPCGEELVFCDETERGFSFAVETGSALKKETLFAAKAVCLPLALAETADTAEYRRTLAKGLSLSSACAYICADCSFGESSTDNVYSGHRLIAENGKITEESGLFTDGLTLIDIDIETTDRIRSERGLFADTSAVRRVFVSTKDSCGKPLRKIPRAPFLPEDESGETEEKIMQIQTAGLKRRMEACGCKKLLVGVSGGLDSALALLIACRAARDRKDVIAVTMPCFGSSARTKTSAKELSKSLGVDFREISIEKSVSLHLKDIGHDENVKNAAYENSQARERTQVLLDLANDEGGLVVGTGDMSELALGFTTYNGDQMSSYGVNGSVPKTLVKRLVLYCAEKLGGQTGETLRTIAGTAISPELLPPEKGKIAQKTEDIIGKYVYHDFFLYYGIRWGFSPKKVMCLALCAFGEKEKEDIKSAMKIFYGRFFSQQFKRSCMPDGAAVGELSLSPRRGFLMPSDAVAELWLKEVESL